MRDLLRMIYRDPIGAGFAIGVAVAVPVVTLAWLAELVRMVLR